LTIWTYWVFPTSPFVSGGAQLQLTPGKGMPSHWRIGLGIAGMPISVLQKLLWITGSGPSWCWCGSLGLRFASCSVSVGGQINGCSRSGRDKSLCNAGITVVSPNCCAFGDALAWAEAFENAPEPSSATRMPASTKTEPTKTRRLKKADCEVDFFFMVGVVLRSHFWLFTGVLQEIPCEVTRKVGCAALSR